MKRRPEIREIAWHIVVAGTVTTVLAFPLFYYRQLNDEHALRLLSVAQLAEDRGYDVSRTKGIMEHHGFWLERETNDSIAFRARSFRTLELWPTSNSVVLKIEDGLVRDPWLGAEPYVFEKVNP